jgi:hypothetical protein
VAVSYAGAQFLVNACRDGVNFERTLTLGRQDLIASPILLTRLLKRNGLLTDPAALRKEITRWPYRADRLFNALGTRELSFMDNTPYEGANVLHDLNDPVPGALHERYDVVVDSGTLEHVFNFPVALKSTMEMVAVGGHAIFLTPTNNMPGHGFYQFSPELYHQALSRENGYRVERMLAIEDELVRAWILGRVPVAVQAQRGAYEIPAPPPSTEFGERIEFTTTRPTHLFVLASRLENVPVLVSPPQQAIYRALWDKSASGEESASGPVPRPLNPQGRAAGLGLSVALHLAFGGVGRMLRPFRSLAVSRHYRSMRLNRQRRGIKRSDQIEL